MKFHFEPSTVLCKGLELSPGCTPNASVEQVSHFTWRYGCPPEAVSQAWKAVGEMAEQFRKVGVHFSPSDMPILLDTLHHYNATPNTKFVKARRKQGKQDREKQHKKDRELSTILAHALCGLLSLEIPVSPGIPATDNRHFWFYHDKWEYLVGEEEFPEGRWHWHKLDDGLMVKFQVFQCVLALSAPEEGSPFKLSSGIRPFKCKSSLREMVEDAGLEWEARDEQGHDFVVVAIVTKLQLVLGDSQTD